MLIFNKDFGLGTMGDSGGSTPVVTGKYKLLQRVKDDSNHEIGTVIGFFTDANNVEYAVVCLDAQYRTNNVQWCSTSASVTNLPIYSDLVSSNIWESKETATQNTQTILDFCAKGGYTAQACSACRSVYFTINGVVYYGQLPNEIEVYEIAKNYHTIETMDPTASSYSSTNFSSGHDFLSSNQYSTSTVWRLHKMCYLNGGTKNTTSNFACPVLELPNAL